ncbi:hypothetical protein ACH9DO_09695 [Kocuria sp. M1N1S27]|uniref:hypothetical protein n=1 Tax=Kocuria kalidii TaxID=3376283 RepID=UPI0037B94A33
MSQQHPGSTDEKAAPSPLPVLRDDRGTAATAPVHCGRPMPVRLLDFADVQDRVNHAVAQAALDGQQVHACECGFLQEAPLTDGPAASIVPDGGAMLFRPFFTRRVLAAAGRAETAEWSFDQALGDAGPLAVQDAEDQSRRLWAFEADLEGERWRLDQAVETLRDELRLAVRHGVPVTLLAREAALDEADVEDLLHPGEVPAQSRASEPAPALAAAC